NHGDAFEQSAIDAFQCEFEDVGKPIKLRVAIIPKSIQGRNRWYLEKIQLIKHMKQNLKEETYFFVLDNWIGHETDYYFDIPITNSNRISMDRTTYRVITKTSDIDGINCDANVFIIISADCSKASPWFFIIHSDDEPNVPNNFKLTSESQPACSICPV
ncbi:unnamed protein product, partial [Rotaria sp. Silwood2]